MSTYTAARSNQNTTPARPGNGSTDNGTVKVYTSILTTRTPVLQTTTGNTTATPGRIDENADQTGSSVTMDSGIDTTMLLGIAAVGGALLLRKKKKRK